MIGPFAAHVEGMRDQQQINAVREMIRARKSNAEIIAATGMNAGAIAYHRGQLGVPARTSPMKVLTDLDAVREMTLANLTPAQIAARLGVEDYTVRRAQVNLQLHVPTPPKPIDEELALRLLTDGTGYSEAARTLDCDPPTLSRRFPGFGWTNEDRSVMASILKNRDLARLHRELQRAD